MLLQFTGIGCGPCQVSIPFLNRLKKDFNTDDLEVVAIETWMRKAHSLLNYENRHQISYKFLIANDSVVNAYQAEGAVPVFFILDQDGVIRKKVTGFRMDVTDQEIIETIKELLSK